MSSLRLTSASVLALASFRPDVAVGLNGHPVADVAVRPQPFEYGRKRPFHVSQDFMEGPKYLVVSLSGCAGPSLATGVYERERVHRSRQNLAHLSKGRPVAANFESRHLTFL